MQLPPADEIVMVAGTPPIRAKKARYFEDRRLQERIIPPPDLLKTVMAVSDDWSGLPLPMQPRAHPAASASDMSGGEDPTGSEKRYQPELNRTTAETPLTNVNEIINEFDTEADDDSVRVSRLNQIVQGVARQVSLDPNDGMDL